MRPQLHHYHQGVKKSKPRTRRASKPVQAQEQAKREVQVNEQVVSNVVRQQFDHAILVKHKELSEIEARIAQVRKMKKRLEDYHNQDWQLYYRRNDGVRVRLQCMVCGARQFHNFDHFLSHCDTEHNIAYKTLSYASWQCGVPVDSRGEDLSCKTPHLAAFLAKTNHKNIDLHELLEETFTDEETTEPQSPRSMSPEAEAELSPGKRPNLKIREGSSGFMGSITKYMKIRRFF